MPFMTQADKDILYEHRHTRKSTALYNLMTYLPYILLNISEIV